ncbi:aryl-sulfate sulfotransferase [Algibacter sp. L1A34]|uniref:aryl-sulfate sulfotransferase n=1 Tax=Algibacter sp. L1A34 TaxID=2686365 RepID=UPI00131D8FD6|nr:aryl-sulfate sulfotransferase [Algibacter sp. L1A34]
MKFYFFCFLLCFNLNLGFSQNTVGTIINSSEAFEGYTLFSFGKKTYLIDNCGQRINEWTSEYISIGVVYLLEDGSLLRSATLNNSTIFFGGVTGRIEKFDWDGNLVWSFEYSDNNKRLHHDFCPLPNGNILALAVTKLSNQQAIDLGRNPNTIVANLYNEQIIEIEPIGTNMANIVWQWNIKDHLIQDFDNTKPDFGIVSEHSEKLNINYLNENPPIANWLHYNSIQYNENLKQIILSSRLMSEIYIIEHTQSTAIAASNTGGIYNKGGDFLYRWGNPEAYNKGDITSQKLFGQHFPHWIPEGLPQAGKLMIFNNGSDRSPNFSEVFIITPPINESGLYPLQSDETFGPKQPDYIYHNEAIPQSFYSAIVSGSQMLPNGNILICDGDSGRIFEINNEKNIVWDYVNPVINTGVLSQGDIPNGNLVFRATKYAMDYAAFNNRNLTPYLPIETNPNLSGCESLSIKLTTKVEFKIYPIPTKQLLTIKSNKPIDRIMFYDTFGTLLKTLSIKKLETQIDVSSFSSGLYIMTLKIDEENFRKKIIKA